MSTVPFLCHKEFPLEGVPALSYTFYFHGHWAQNTTTWHMVVQKTRQWLEFIIKKEVQFIKLPL